MKQSQSQKQNVVVNIGNHTRQRRRRNRAPLRSAHGSVVKHVHSYTGNVFQANLERENAQIVREQNILRQERAEIQKLKQNQAKLEQFGTALTVPTPEFNTPPPKPNSGARTASKSDMRGLLSRSPPNERRKTPDGRANVPPPRSANENAVTEVPSYMSETKSSRMKTSDL
jgi:hypothetical protein